MLAAYLQLIVFHCVRYATTPLPMSYLLDSGISECGDDRQLCGEEQFQDTEKEKEDCYVCMQSANVL